MSSHPVQLQVEPPPTTERIHVVIRILLLFALGTIGVSWASCFLYLVVPALVALRILNGGAERYLAEDAPRVVRALRWLASACAQGSPVDLAITPGGEPTPKSALLRLLTSLPAALLLAILSVAAGVWWLVGAVVVLIRRRMPAAIADFITGVLRYQFRLIAYHLSIVDRYPTFGEARTAHAAGSSAA